jgi:hypothetical protein
MMCRVWVSVLAVLSVTAAACGGGGSGSADATVDTGGDGPPKTIVGITTFADSPAIFEYRDGSGDWQDVPAPSLQGVSQIEVTNDYVVFQLCTGAGNSADAQMVAATVADGDQFIGCFSLDSSTTGQPQAFPVTGTMVQAGSVVIQDDSASSATPSWPFSLSATAGTYDLAAFDSANTSMLIRRGIDVESPGLAIASALDLSTEGSATVHTTVALADAADGAVISLNDALFTENSFIDLPAGSAAGSATATVITAPPAFLTTNDLESVEIDADTTATSQEASIFAEGPADVPDAIDLLPALSGITFTPATGTIGAAWTTLPSAEHPQLYLVIANAEVEQGIQATPAWIALHGMTQLAFDTTAKGYKAIWYIDPTQPYAAELTLESTTATGLDLSTGFNDPVGSAGLRRRAMQQRRAAQVMGAKRKILP